MDCWLRSRALASALIHLLYSGDVTAEEHLLGRARGCSDLAGNDGRWAALDMLAFNRVIWATDFMVAPANATTCPEVVGKRTQGC